MAIWIFVMKVWITARAKSVNVSISEHLNFSQKRKKDFECTVSYWIHGLFKNTLRQRRVMGVCYFSVSRTSWHTNVLEFFRLKVCTWLGAFWCIVVGINERIFAMKLWPKSWVKSGDFQILFLYVLQCWTWSCFIKKFSQWKIDIAFWSSSYW